MALRSRQERDRRRQSMREAMRVRGLREAGALPSIREKHFTVPELADMWGVDRSTVRGWLKGEPGVLNIGSGRRCHLRIPESVASRIYRRRLQSTPPNLGEEI